jgi:hypothetical protein
METITPTKPLASTLVLMANSLTMKKNAICMRWGERLILLAPTNILSPLNLWRVEVLTMRYSLQEMNGSGFTYYEIIDTENACKVVFSTKSYIAALDELKRLEKEGNP